MILPFWSLFFLLFFFFNDTATTEIYTLSLHDALPISVGSLFAGSVAALAALGLAGADAYRPLLDRKSTRLNSSHRTISYAVFCLKKKKTRPSTLMTEMTSTTVPVQNQPSAE